MACAGMSSWGIAARPPWGPQVVVILQVPETHLTTMKLKAQVLHHICQVVSAGSMKGIDQNFGSHLRR
jgi:hypothetical protein